MHSRRQFLLDLLSIIGALSASGYVAHAKSLHEHANPLKTFEGENVLTRILSKASTDNWRALPIGELMGMIAKELEGTPYKSNTLELSPNHELCSVNLNGLDCVTFFETTLDLARMLKKGGHSSKDLVKAVEFTRYRSGVPGDFSTRLHYTSDWLYDNESKRVIKILADLPGAESPIQKVSFMSSHPDSYLQLRDNPTLVTKMRACEKAINNRSMNFVPMDKIAAVEPLLQTGDIVGVCTNVHGLDIAHTGIVIRTADGVAHFMDASTKIGKVTLEPDRISTALGRSKSWTGAIFARPLEP